MTDDVQPITKDSQTRRPGQHERGCPCRSCIGRRNRLKGQRKQRQALKILAAAEGSVARFWTQYGNEETANLARWQVEVKAGKQVPVFIANAVKQARKARAIGSLRKILVLCIPQGASEREAMAVLALDDLLEIADAAYACWEDRCGRVV